MGFDIAISEESRKQSPLALCGPLLREALGLTLPDPGGFLGVRTVRTLNPDFRGFTFVNRSEPLPAEPSERLWACAYRVLNGEEVEDYMGKPMKIVTDKSKYEFLGFLSRTEFEDAASRVSESKKENRWESLGYELHPDKRNHCGNRKEEICASCPVKDFTWGDCHPRLMGAGSVSSFLAGLDFVLHAASKGDSRERETLKTLEKALNLDRPELDTRFAETLGFYTASQSWIERRGLRILFGRMGSIQSSSHQLTQRIFSALVLRPHGTVFSQEELGNLIPPLTSLHFFASALISGQKGEPLKHLLEFHSIFETFVRALMMARLHKLEISVSF